MRRSAVATSDTCVAPAAASVMTAAASKPGSTVSGVDVWSARRITDSPPMWATGKQASHRCLVGSTPSRGARRVRGRLDRIVREDDALRSAGRAARRHHERVAGVDRSTAGACDRRAAGVDDLGHTELVELLRDEGGRQAVVDGEHGVARIPRTSQLVDEARTGGHGERDEPVHGD